MGIYCESCHHTYFNAYYPKHLKTNLHTNRTFVQKIHEKPNQDYVCNSCNRTHKMSDIIKYNKKSYTRFEGCTTCAYSLKLI